MRIFIVNALHLSGIVVSLATFLSACGGRNDAPTPCQGAKACQCYPNATCNQGLLCESNLCVERGGAGGTPSDSGLDVAAGGSGGSGRESGAAGGSGGAGGGSSINTLGSGGAFSFPDAALPRSDQVDLLFMIDNSSSMADKQQILAAVVADLVNRFINPACIDPVTGMVLGQRLPTGGCAAGVLDFAPVMDMRIGIISSSLGSHGATNSSGQEVCPDPDPDPTKMDAHDKDMAHLLNRSLVNGLDGFVPQAATGFLSWSGMGSADNIIMPFQSMVTGVGQHGCGYESQLEAIYRFLNDPEPYASITLEGASGVNPGAARPTGVDTVVLQQRQDFLRPNSVVAVIAVTDENDCSINDNNPQGFFALLPPVSAQQGQISQLRRGTSVCETNPNDPCCSNCGVLLSMPGCPSPSSDPACVNNGGILLRSQDPENLRCFDQKRRYGLDFLFPVDRYIDGLLQPMVHDRNGNLVANPLYVDLKCGGGFDPSGMPCTPAPRRDPRQVFLAGIIGVPWQDLAVDPNDLSKGYKTAAQLKSENVWARILGDPTNPAGPVLPTEIHMIESVSPRPGLPGPDSAAAADPINGHEWDISKNGPPNADLQYACVFDLPVPTPCDPMNPDCDCNDGIVNQGGTVADMKRPLCQSKDTGAYGHTQFRAKAYPGTRELQVLRGLGDQGIVASICPANTSNNARPDFGYRPAVSAIIQRLRPPLQIR